MSADPPNLDLLIKLLKMTTASNDGEALVAMRKANEQLAKFGGDWETLLRGKVSIIADPFANINIPTPQPRNAPPPPAPRRPAPPPPPFHPASTPQPAQAPKPASRGLWPKSQPNRYAGTCANCKNVVAPADGLACQDYNNGLWYTKHYPNQCPPKPKRAPRVQSTDDLIF